MAYRPLTDIPISLLTNSSTMASGYVLEAYVTNTTTPATMYSDASGTTAGTSITLDARGEPTTIKRVWLDTAVNYKLILKTDAGATVWTVDPVYGTQVSSVTVTPQLFGAVADGVTNDAAAVQAAIDYLTDGGTVLFPPGTYLIGTQVTVSSGKILLQGTRGASILKQSGNVIVLYVQASDVEVTGLKLQGDQSGGSSSRTNLLVIGGSGQTPARVSVHHNDFVDASSTCVLLGGDQAACSDIHVHHNTMTNFWECGFDCVTAGQQRVYVTDNIMVSNTSSPNAAVSRPIGVGHEPQTSGTSSDFFIERNYIDFSGVSVPNRNTTHGVYAGKASSPPSSFTAKRWSISGNIIRGVGQGVRLLNARWGTTTDGATVSVCNNIIEAARDHGMYLVGGENSTHYDSILVNGNTIRGYSEYSSNQRDAINLDGYWYKPTLDGNYIANRNNETGSTGGRYGINIAAATITESLIGDNTIVSALSGRINDASAGASINRINRSHHVYLNTAATIAGNIEYTPDLGSIIFRAPSGADRNIEPSASAANAFLNGHLVYVVNPGTTSFNLVFDPSGINVRVGPNSGALFAYDASLAAWRHIRIGASVLQQRETAANIASAAATINTADKYLGKIIWDTTNTRAMVANGTNATSAWIVIDGSATVTPA